MKSNINSIQRIQEFVEEYNSDEAVIPWMANICNKIRNDQDSDLDNLILEHTLSSYWTDLGGEGA